MHTPPPNTLYFRWIQFTFSKAWGGSTSGRIIHLGSIRICLGESHENPRASVFVGKDLVPPIEYSVSIDDVLRGVRSEIFVDTHLVFLRESPLPFNYWTLDIAYFGLNRKVTKPNSILDWIKCSDVRALPRTEKFALYQKFSSDSRKWNIRPRYVTDRNSFPFSQKVRFIQFSDQSMGKLSESFRWVWSNSRTVF
jgi:hypothetical protein